MRRRGLLGLTVWVAAMAVLAPSASACVWCDPDQWLDFQDCLYWKILNEPYFQQIPAGALEDMRESVLAASRASTKRTGSSMKMKMIVGAMGGELSEMMRPLPDYARSKAVLMDVIRVCNVDATGQPDSTFIDELSKTLDFMLGLPSYDNPESVPGNNNNAFPRDAGQSLTNLNGQIINSSPNFNNMRQPQPEQILPSAGSIQNNAAPYTGNNQQAQSGIAVQNNLNAGSGLPAQVVTGQSNVNVVGLSYPPQPQITNANGANGINTFNQNPSTNPSITNANAASSSYSITQNANLNPGSKPYPLNPGYFNQPQVTRANAASSANSYNLASATTISNTGQIIPQNSIPNQYPSTDFSIISNQQPNNPINNLQNQQIPTQSINQPQSSFIGSGTKTFETNAQNVPQNYQGNQFNQYPVSNLNELGQNRVSVQRQTNQNNDGAPPNSGLSTNNDYWLQSQGYPDNPALNTPYASSSGSSAATNSNLQSFVTQNIGKFPVNYPAVTNKIRKFWGKLQNRTPDLNKQQQNNINGVKNQKSLQSSPIDDDIARAMRFVETFYVILSQSNTFKKVFNEQVPNDKALSLVYEIDVGALNDCGYSQFSDEIANACAVSIQSLPDGCSSEQYAEALSKTVMDQLNMKKLIRQNPEDQAKCIANNLLTRLQKIYPTITTTFAQPLLADNTENGKKLQNRTPDLNKQQQNNINGVKNEKSLQSSPIDDDVARAMRFAETFYVTLSQSDTFKRVFNEQVPNDKALSLMYEIDVGALNDCGYSQFSDEIANACAVSIQSLPDGISSAQYAEALSKTVMDQLNMKKLIQQNPEDQAKCIANNLLTRLQKIYPTITTTFTQPLLADNTESTLNQGPGSESQLTNANSGSYSSYQNPDIQTQSMNSNGARIYRPNVNQNIPRSNLQNQFLQGNDVPINNAVRSNLINKPKNQLNFGPGPMNQQTDSSAIATNKNIGTNLNFQNTDQTYNEDGMNNAATIFNQKLINDLLTCPDMSRIYNEGTTKTNAETVTATLLLVSLSTDYANLATEIARESIRRLGSLPTGSNTEAYITLIATSITDGFSYYGLLSQEAPLAQASRISSNIIAWLKGDTNSGNNNQQANINIDAQSNLPNQNAVNYADSYSSVPNLSQGKQASSSEILALNSGGITNYNPNTDNLGPQYLQYNNQNLGSNSLSITNDSLQNIRTSSGANSSSVNTNVNKDKNANRNNKQGSKKPKKKTTVFKTNFNFDNLNDYPVNKAVKSKQNSSPDISNGNSFRDYNGNVIYLPINVPNTQWSGSKNYPVQNINTDYDLTSGTAIIQNDNISGIQQSALPSSVNKSPRKKECKQSKNRKVNNAANKPFIGDDVNAYNYPPNQLNGPSGLDITNNPQTLQRNKYAGSPSNDYGIIPSQNTPPVPTQSQIIPDESNNEVKERIRYLTKGVLSSLTSGKFDYKLFSDIIAEVSQNLQTTHPGLGSQTSLVKTLIDSIIACTQLLKKVPSDYFDDIGLRQNSDIPDAAAIDYSNSISPVQEDQITIQTNQDNVALNDQSNQLLTLPQQSTSNLNNAQIEDFYPGGSAPLLNTNVPPPRQGSVNNVGLNDQSYGLQILPQQNNLNNDQVGNFYPGDSAPLSLRQGSMNNVLQQNNLNNAQTENFYPGYSPPQPNANVLPPTQGAVNNVDIVNNDQNYGPPNLLQNNLNFDQRGQGNFYPGDSAPLLNPNVQPTRPIFEIQSLSQDIGGIGLSNAQTFRGISSQIGQDDSPPLLNGYGGENLQPNNQNGLAFQSSRGFNNPNLKSGSIGNQNNPPGNVFQTELSQTQQMYDTNLPISNQMSNLEEGQIQDKLAKISLIGRLLRK